jgi:uncharacterized protein YciI
MSKPEETALTTGQDDAESPHDQGEQRDAESTGERDAPEGEEKKDPDYKAIQLAQKMRLEEQAQRIRELEQRVMSGPAPAAQDTSTQETDAVVAEQRLEAELERLAPADPASRAALVALRQRRADQRNTMDAFAVMGLPEQDRAPMVKFYEENRRHFQSMAQCIAYVDGERAKMKAAALEKELAETRAKLKPEAERDRGDVVRTTTRDLSTASHKAITMTRQDWKQRQSELYAADKDDQARQEQMDLRSGKIILKG